MEKIKWAPKWIHDQLTEGIILMSTPILDPVVAEFIHLFKKWIVRPYTAPEPAVETAEAGRDETDGSVTREVSNFLIDAAHLISWKSKAGGSITVSSLEAKYVALSKSEKEIDFITNLLGNMRIPTKLPIVVHVDNIGAISMSNNTTKHIDISSSPSM